MRQLPRRKRVGRESLVHQAQSAFRFGIEQLVVKLADLVSEQQSLIDNRARRKRRNVEEALVTHVGRNGHLRFRALADHEQLALKLVCGHPRRTSHKKLLDVWLRSACDTADRIHFYGCVTPPEHRQPFIARDPLEQALAIETLLPFDRQETHRNSILARFRQPETTSRRLARKERVRNLDEHSCAITSLRVTTARSAVRQALQNSQPLQNNVVRSLASNVYNKPEATRVMLVGGVI